LIYASGTTGNTPSASNLTSGSTGAELAINYYDGKLFYKDSGGVVQVLATKGAGTIGGSNTQVQYNNSGTLAGSANLTFNGTTLTANTLNLTNALGVTYGGTGLTSFTANGVVYASSTSALTTGSALVFDGTNFVNTAGFLGTTQSGATSSYFIAKNSVVTSGVVFGAHYSGAGYIDVINSNPLFFATNDTERMRIDTSGNLLVGTTAQVGTANTPLTLRKGGISWQVGPANANGNFYVLNASDVGVYLANNGTSWTANSDERLKTNLIPFENAASKVATLRAGTGRYLTDEEKVSRSFLIAQDVLAVLPEAVDVQNDEQGTLGLRYQDLIPLLTAAIQEQQALITQLQADVAALKAQVTTLQTQVTALKG
jgi:hypothetical protein